MSKYNQPPYQFCDGGDVTETPEKNDQGGATHSVSLPKIIKVGYTDPDTNEKVVKELDISKIPRESLVADIQKGHFMDKRIGDERKKYKTLEHEVGSLKEQISMLAAQRGTTVEEEVKRILDARNQETEPIVDTEAVKNGDMTSIIKAYEFEKSQRKKLERAFMDRLQKDEERDKIQNEIAKTHANVNEAIKETLAEYPNLKEEKFIAEVKRLKLVTDPDGIRNLGNLMSKLSQSGATLETLPKEEQEKIKAQAKAELETPPPPTPGGDTGTLEPPKNKESPVTMDSLEKKAKEVRKKYFGGS